jgi:hypothetical protein
VVIPLRGQAFDPETGDPARFSNVSIQVESRGTLRWITAVTDGNGQFTASFRPLAEEAGTYRIAADHPSVFERTPQDSFVLLGMRAVQTPSRLDLLPNQQGAGQFQIRNLADVPLTGLTLRVEGAPAWLNVQVSGPPSIAADGTVTIAYTATASIQDQVAGQVQIVAETAQGTTLRVPLSIAVTPLTPKLVANVGFLQAGMMRGEQTLVSFEVTNTGGAPTGPLQLLLPQNAPWLSAGVGGGHRLDRAGWAHGGDAAPEPGGGPAAQPLHRLHNPARDQPELSLNYQFRAISEAVGDAVIRVENEFTYFAEGRPRLEGARVTLTDPYTSQIVATGFTGADGEIRFTNLAEGTYQLSVNADKHAGQTVAFTVKPGITNELDIFIHRQAVSYKWNVVPVEQTDRYRVVLETEFETNVPQPVVTVDQPRLFGVVFPRRDHAAPGHLPQPRADRREGAAGRRARRPGLHHHAAGRRHPGARGQELRHHPDHAAAAGEFSSRGADGGCRCGRRHAARRHDTASMASRSCRRAGATPSRSASRSKASTSTSARATSGSRRRSGSTPCSAPRTWTPCGGRTSKSSVTRFGAMRAGPSATRSAPSCSAPARTTAPRLSSRRCVVQSRVACRAAPWVRSQVRSAGRSMTSCPASAQRPVR